MATFQLKIITPQAVVFDGPVESVQAPGGDGYLGVLAGHAPLLTTLQDGKLTASGAGQGSKSWQVTGGGFLEVHKNKVTVLAQNLSAQ
ncbi:TPA: ATP synthase F1 subunit epsilon [Candidatus Sumerlaeota bacterium]|jgi:F-type H+-transporting ATPase subunit epsilon|nr:ATP synthase F1 subunit epsilon [Candidatus Sumerlaeota bacterium]